MLYVAAVCDMRYITCFLSLPPPSLHSLPPYPSLISIISQEVEEQESKEELPNTIWWKMKKWAMHLLAKIFERYGNTNNISKIVFFS